MKAPSWTNEEKLILLENVKTFDDIVNKKFSSTVTKKTKRGGVAEDSYQHGSKGKTERKYSKTVIN